MYNCYLVDNSDGISNQIFLEIDPILSPVPNTERQVKQYTSVTSFYLNGTIKNPVSHWIDSGVPSQSGFLNIIYKHLSLGIFLQLCAKFTANPPTLQNLYDYRRNILYEGIILRNHKSDYVEGVEDYENLAGTQQRVVSGSFEAITTGDPAIPF